MTCRLLTLLETLLLRFCDNERQAIVLAPHVRLADNLGETPSIGHRRVSESGDFECNGDFATVGDTRPICFAKCAAHHRSRSPKLADLPFDVQNKTSSTHIKISPTV